MAQPPIGLPPISLIPLSYDVLTLRCSSAIARFLIALECFLVWLYP
jgi:hypothetical protein